MTVVSPPGGDLTGFPNARLAARPGLMTNLKSTTLASTTTVSITTGGTFYDISGLSVKITPYQSTSKVLIMGHVHVASYLIVPVVRIVRDSTAVGVGDSAGSRISTTAGVTYNTTISDHTNSDFPIVFRHLDSPATTSEITYKLQISHFNNSVTAYINRGQGDTNTKDFIRATSVITAIEVLQ